MISFANPQSFQAGTPASVASENSGACAVKEAVSTRKRGGKGACQDDEAVRVPNKQHNQGSPSKDLTTVLKQGLESYLRDAKSLVSTLAADPDLWDFACDAGRQLIQAHVAHGRPTPSQVKEIELRVAKLREVCDGLSHGFESKTVHLLAKKAAVAMMVEEWLDQQRENSSQLTLSQCKGLLRRQQAISTRISRYLRRLDEAKRLELAVMDSNDRRKRDARTQQEPSIVEEDVQAAGLHSSALGPQRDAQKSDNASATAANRTACSMGGSHRFRDVWS